MSRAVDPHAAHPGAVRRVAAIATLSLVAALVLVAWQPIVAPTGSPAAQAAPPPPQIAAGRLIARG